MRFRRERGDGRFVQIGSVQESEGNAVAAARVERGKRGDDFPRFDESGRERAQLLVERGEVERLLDGDDVLSRAHVFEQAMLFVFGERLARLLVDRQFGKWI